ncbi:MAG: hypothetical protein HQM09_22125, partial [Candidatus Riflebacteria bacterium]|nr:hypothetical protein [Candidatus Riflebacteria bacterium]
TQSIRTDDDLPLKLHIGTATYPGDATHSDGLLEKSGEALSHAIGTGIAVISWNTMHVHADKDGPPS